MFEIVSPFFGHEEVIVFECRRCGQTLDANAERCPHCGPTDVVRFEVD